VTYLRAFLAAEQERRPAVSSQGADAEQARDASRRPNYPRLRLEHWITDRKAQILGKLSNVAKVNMLSLVMRDGTQT
jgi:hypothetical protein